MSDTQTQEEVQYTEVEEKALAQGWRPIEDWEGDKADFVDATQFIFRGELMDRIKSQTKKLSRQELEITTLKDGFKSYQEHATKLAKVEFDNQIKQLKDLKKTALEEDDYDTVIEVDDKLADIKVQQAEEAAPPPKEELTHLDPTVEAWVESNQWYKDDPIMRGAADAVANSIRTDNPDWSVKEILDEVSAKVDAKFKQAPAASTPNTVSEPTGTKRSSKTTKFKKNNLNEEQLRIGRTFVSSGAIKSLDEYAQQLGDIGELT